MTPDEIEKYQAKEIAGRIERRAIFDAAAREDEARAAMKARHTKLGAPHQALNEKDKPA